MDKKVLRWNFVFQYGYVITNIINSLILLPFYLKRIDASTLGVWLATGNILAWMTLIDPGIGEVLQQKIAELLGRDEKTEIGKTIGSGLIASGCILLLAVIAGFVFYSLIGVIINKDVTRYPNLQIALFISIIATGMSLTSFSMSGINQGLQNASQVAISSIAANILFLIVNVSLLLLGFNIISIAFANMCRALFINIYNFTTLKHVLNKGGMQIIFEKLHFQRFIKIFSFTSVASIIGGLSASMDTIFLARFVKPSVITLFEINKRPVQLTGSLVGRHSVALMPTLSHAQGKNDQAGILNLIAVQFKYYSYAALFIALGLIFNYYDLITAWTGNGKYVGDTIIRFLAANFFFGLIGYFMSNVSYALGDIKVNSLINILRGLIMGVAFYFGSKYYGILGLVFVMFIGSITIDLPLFSYRLFKIGYLKPYLIKETLSLWIIVIPLALLAGIGSSFVVNRFMPHDLHSIKILVNGSLFTVLFAAIVFTLDRKLRENILETIRTFIKRSSLKSNEMVKEDY